jgi:hypothetical protein
MGQSSHARRHKQMQAQFYKIRLRLFFKLQVSFAKKTKSCFYYVVLRLNNGLAQVGLDGRTMSSSNAAVQQSKQDVNYLALELNLYISK